MGIHQRHNLANMEVPGVTLEENLKGNRFKGLILNKQPLFNRHTDTVFIRKSKFCFETRQSYAGNFWN